jgi:hypothetical protein
VEKSVVVNKIDKGQNAYLMYSIEAPKEGSCRQASVGQTLKPPVVFACAEIYKFFYISRKRLFCPKIKKPATSAAGF